jgi:hypothetical protein
MKRIASLATLALLASVLFAERSRQYVVRVDLDEIAAPTADGAAQPGFSIPSNLQAE